MGLLCTNPRYCFIHIQRTGGKSITQTLLSLGGDFIQVPMHTSILDMRRDYPKAMLETFTFAFVRNPWDAYVSWYHSTFFQMYPTFTDFIMQWKEWWNSPHFRFRSQVGAIVDEAGRGAVDFLGRYERLEEDFSRVLAMIGLPDTPLQRYAEQSRPPGPYQDFYNTDTRRIVWELALPTIMACNYTFD